MPRVKIFNNTALCFSYSGEWSYKNKSCGEMNDYYASDEPNSTITVRFYGTNIALYGYRSASGGMLGVSIDEQSEVVVDTYSNCVTGNDTELLYMSTTMNDDKHKMVVRLLPKKNNDSAGHKIQIARCMIWSQFSPLHVHMNDAHILKNPVLRYIPLQNPKNPPSQHPITWIMDMEVYGYHCYTYDAVTRTSHKYGGLADTFGAYIVSPGEWGYQYHNNGPKGVGYQHAPQTKQDAYNMIHQYFQQQCKDTLSCQGKWLCPMTGHYYYPHYAGYWGCQMGVPMLSTEVGENIRTVQAHIAFLRGAARQFAKPFGIQFSPWYGQGVLDYSQKDPCWPNYSGPNNGHSLELFRRAFYYSYLCGASVAHLEGSSVNWFNGEQTDENGCFYLSPLGTIGKEFYNFKSNIARGIPFVPVGVMLDKYHGLNNLQVEPDLKLFYGQIAGTDQYSYIEPTAADHMNAAFFNTIWPGSFEPSPWDEEGYYFTNNAPHSDIYDVIMDDAPSQVLDAYRVIYVSGDAHPDMHAIMHYVREQGGTVIINSRHLSGFNDTHNFLGVTIQPAPNCAPEMHVNGVRVFTPHPKAHKELTYNVSCTVPAPDILTITSAQPFMIADNGTLLATVHHTGHGRVIVTSPPYLSCKEIIRILLLQIEQSVLPMAVFGDVQTLYNKTHDGWLVLLINNKGITKQPCAAPCVDPAKTQKISICVDVAQEYTVSQYLGQNSVFQPVSVDYAGQITLSIPPGDLCLLRFQRHNHNNNNQNQNNNQNHNNHHRPLPQLPNH